MDTTRGSLVARIRDLNDTQAWSEFDAIYRPLLARFARQRGLNPAAAEDVVQQCMSAVARHIGDFRYDPDRCRFRSWLRLLAEGRIRNHLRKRKVALARSRDLAAVVDPQMTPAETFEQIWIQEHLRYCLTQLRQEISDSIYEAFDLYVLQERPVEEICHRLSMTRNQVYNIKWRVAQKLQARMVELTGEGRNGNPGLPE